MTETASDDFVILRDRVASIVSLLNDGGCDCIVSVDWVSNATGKRGHYCYGDNIQTR